MKWDQIEYLYLKDLYFNFMKIKQFLKKVSELQMKFCNQNTQKIKKYQGKRKYGNFDFWWHLNWWQHLVYVSLNSDIYVKIPFLMTFNRICHNIYEIFYNCHIKCHKIMTLWNHTTKVWHKYKLELPLKYDTSLNVTNNVTKILHKFKCY